MKPIYCEIQNQWVKEHCGYAHCTRNKGRNGTMRVTYLHIPSQTVVLLLARAENYCLIWISGEVASVDYGELSPCYCNI
jgi:hypothetical protein